MTTDYMAMAVQLARAAVSTAAQPANDPEQHPLKVSDGVIRIVSYRTIGVTEEPRIIGSDGRGDPIWTAADQTYQIHAGDDVSSALLARRCVWAQESGLRVRLTWFAVNGVKVLRDFEVLEAEPE